MLCTHHHPPSPPAPFPIRLDISPVPAVAHAIFVADDGSQITRGGFRIDWAPAEDQQLTVQGDVYDGKADQRVLTVSDRTLQTTMLPDTAKEKPQEGKVLAVGPGTRNDAGERVQMDVAVNDIVLYAKYAGTEVKLEGEKVLVLRESDILAIVEK